MPASGLTFPFILHKIRKPTFNTNFEEVILILKYDFFDGGIFSSHTVIGVSSASLQEIVKLSTSVRFPNLGNMVTPCTAVVP